MTQLAIALERPPLSPEAFRVRCYLALLLTTAVVGCIQGAAENLLALAWLCLWWPAYLVWVVSDLRALRATGWRFWGPLLLFVLPFLPLLSFLTIWVLPLYFLWTRRLQGILQWLAFSMAIVLVYGSFAGLAHGLAHFAQGKPW